MKYHIITIERDYAARSAHGSVYSWIFRVMEKKCWSARQRK